MEEEKEKRLEEDEEARKLDIYANIFSVISLIIHMGAIVLYHFFIGSFHLILYLISLIIIIFVRKKFPNNKLSKIVAIIYSVEAVLAIIWVLFIVFACSSMSGKIY